MFYVINVRTGEVERETNNFNCCLTFFEKRETVEVSSDGKRLLFIATGIFIGFLNHKID